MSASCRVAVGWAAAVVVLGFCVGQTCVGPPVRSDEDDSLPDLIPAGRYTGVITCTGEGGEFVIREFNAEGELLSPDNRPVRPGAQYREESPGPTRTVTVRNTFAKSGKLNIETFQSVAPDGSTYSGNAREEYRLRPGGSLAYSLEIHAMGVRNGVSASYTLQCQGTLR